MDGFKTLEAGQSVVFNTIRGKIGLHADEVYPGALPTDPAEARTPDHLAVTFVDGEYRLVSCSRDAKYKLLDPAGNGALLGVGRSVGTPSSTLPKPADGVPQCSCWAISPMPAMLLNRLLICAR